MADLEKKLGFLDVFCIASGAMISSGIFILPGLAFSKVGPAVFLAYLFAGILALIGIFSIIELATAMPKAGGDYYFINRSMGPLTGTVSGFLSWFALILKSAFAIFGLAELVYLLTGLPAFPVAAVITAIFTGLNLYGVNEAAKLEVILVIGLLLLMGVFIVTGFSSVEVSRFDPFIKKDGNFNTIIATAGFVFISFGGLLNAASISEEVSNPVKNIPLAMIASIGVVTVIYTLMLVVAVGILPATELKGSLTPIADAGRITLGTPGYIIITIAAALAFVTTANAGIMAASRYPLALSRDGLAPGFLGRLRGRSGMPLNAILITGLLIILSLLMKLEMLVKAASTVILTSYVLSNLAVIILRESRIQSYRPGFKTPFYPWLQIGGIIIFGCLIVELGTQAIEISLGMLAISLIIFLFYGHKTKSEYALLHLIERITNRRLTSRNLENELREIIRSRDEVIEDDFDKLVKKASVMDIEEGPMELNDFFRKIAENYAREMKLDQKEFFDMLKEREAESSTALTPMVAVPHLIAEGEKLFKILIVRCRQGVKFSPQNENIKAIFVIAGTRDMRNHHLKTLAAIAQIIQSKQFEERWLEAKGGEQLRDILLLGKRKRS